MLDPHERVIFSWRGSHMIDPNEGILSTFRDNIIILMMEYLPVQFHNKAKNIHNIMNVVLIKKIKQGCTSSSFD